jgi:crotonobetainyl-CoA:carnitine CoA-transferase CaiB-like acyl-CoA transferase
MVTDPRYDTFQHRFEHRAEVYRIVDDWVMAQPSVDNVVTAMDEAGVPCDRVNTIEQAVNHPQVKARRLLVERHHSTLGPMTVVNSGLNFSRTDADPPGQPPFLGEHNREILEGLLGMAPADVAKLTAAKVLYEDPRLKRAAAE